MSDCPAGRLPRHWGGHGRRGGGGGGKDASTADGDNGVEDVVEEAADGEAEDEEWFRSGVVELSDLSVCVIWSEIQQLGFWVEFASSHVHKS